MSDFCFDISLDKFELTGAQNLNIRGIAAHKDVVYTISRAASVQLAKLKDFVGDGSPSVFIRFRMPGINSTNLEISCLRIEDPAVKTKFESLGVDLERQVRPDEDELTAEQTEAVLKALPPVARQLA